MITLTAILTAKRGFGDKMYDELLKVGEYVRANEPDTLGFYVTRDSTNPNRFVTHERFRDQAAMDFHNEGAGSQGFFEACGNDLFGEITVIVGDEIFER